jgi:hypothetical protein
MFFQRLGVFGERRWSLSGQTTPPIINKPTRSTLQQYIYFIRPSPQLYAYIKKTIYLKQGAQAQNVIGGSASGVQQFSRCVLVLNIHRHVRSPSIVKV